MPNGSSKVASFSVFANFLDPRYCDTSLKKTEGNVTTVKCRVFCSVHLEQLSRVGKF